MNKRLLLLGGGGHCKSILDSVISMKSYTEIGIVDKRGNIGKSVLGISIIGCDEDLLELYHSGFDYGFVSLGSIGNPIIRIKLFSLLEDIGFKIPCIIDPTAVISNYVTMSDGIYVGKNAVVNAGTVIGKGAIINTSTTIEHDCDIGQFVHIAPGAILCGEVKIGENVHIGAKSAIKQNVIIGANTLIGMGSIVLNNVGTNKLAFGNPCKEACTK